MPGIPTGADAPAIATTLDFDGDWPSLVARLHAQGAVRQLLAQSELKGVQGQVFQVQVPIRHLAEPSLVERARELLAAVGLDDLADAAPTELSGGELRRMAIARALLMDPAIVLADEPTAGLDSANATAVLTLLRDAADRGTAVLVVSHEAEAQRFADRSYVMEDGHLRASE